MMKICPWLLMAVIQADPKAALDDSEKRPAVCCLEERCAMYDMGCALRADYGVKA